MYLKHYFKKDQGLFKYAGQAKRKPNFIVAPLLSIIIIFAAQILSELIGFFVLGLQERSLIRFVVVSLGLGFGMATLILTAVVFFIEKRSPRTLGFFRENALKNYMKGFGIGLGMMTILVLVTWGLGGLQSTTDFSSSLGINAIGPIFLVLLGWIIQGGTEEVVTRGWLMPMIGTRYNVVLGVIISSLLFSSLHLLNNGISILPMLNLTLFGLFASFYVLKTKEIWGICGFHSAWNWSQGNIFGVEVSGTLPPGGSLFSFQGVNNPIISGGTFGLEGSILCTLLYVLGIAILLLLMNHSITPD